MKLVRVFEEADRSNCMTSLNYRTMVAMLATNPIFSKAPNTTDHRKSSMIS